MRLDARIPVRLVSTAQHPAPSATGVLVRVVDAPVSDKELDLGSGWLALRVLQKTSIRVEHLPGCLCCIGRSPLALALGSLFAERAKAQIPLFDHVVISLPGELEGIVRRILSDDPLVAGRFRLAG